MKLSRMNMSPEGANTYYSSWTLSRGLNPTTTLLFTLSQIAI